MSTASASSRLSQTEIDVLVVGAGFGGLYQLHRLREAGFSVKIFEAGDRSGGTWYWNCYPGSRVDSDFFVYQLSLEEVWKDWNWTERFPDQRELLAYFDHVDNKLDLSRDILFNTCVTGARFDAAENRWNVFTANGITARPRFLVLCTGFAARPIFPDYKGLDTFKGVIHHTALWPREGTVDLKGKRIGVIGTGASGVQIIQETGPSAGRLIVFQRTPNLALPMGQFKVDEATQNKMKEFYPIMFRRRKQTFSGFHFDVNTKTTTDTTPEERHFLYQELWDKGGFNFWLANYTSVFSDETLNAEVYTFWKNKVRERLHNSELQRKLAPDTPPHPFGVKRPSLEQQYYEVYNLPHVTLVDISETPITEVTPQGVRTADGVEHVLDVLVLATGFDAVTGGITQIDIQGTDGVSIGDKWKNDGLSSYLGVSCVNFPNMFYLYGPHGPTAFSNGPTCIELQGDWIIGCIKHMRARGLTKVEPTQAAEAAYTALVGEVFSGGLWHKAKSWYTGANVPGKRIESLNYTGGAPNYNKLCSECSDNEYRGFIFSGPDKIRGTTGGTMRLETKL